MSSSDAAAAFRVSIDVGGTFTDCVVLEPSGSLRQFKVSTVPRDPSTGFVNALEKAAAGYGVALEDFAGRIDLLIHGTTLATNALINGTGARTGMITTKNFRDVIEIRRGFKNVRTSMYDVFIPRYRPLVPRYLRLGVTGRMIESGEELEALDEVGVQEAAETLATEGVASVAICFLHSYASPEHERRARERAKEVLKDAYITTSHEVLPVWREYERFSTTVVSAYVGPLIRDYLQALERRLEEIGFRGTLLLMRSSGMVDTVSNCIARAVDLIGSGPAAAPAGAVQVGRHADAGDLLSIDMGGTSLDVCMLRGGEIPTTTEGWVGDERVAIKMIDIHSIGAGGGSIAWMDSLGLLRVGPRSAGAEPGPACYGRGGSEPTVTDANLLLGFVPSDYFLGGEMRLDRSQAERAMSGLAAKLGLDELATARAVFATVNSNIADAITEVSTRRGYDVRDFALVVGGGAGAVHGAFLAEHLGIERVIVPPVAATYSAFGMFTMDIGRDYARSYIAPASRLQLDTVNRIYKEMEDEARGALELSHMAAKDLRVTRTVEMRYAGQFHEVEVPLANGEVDGAAIQEAIAAFHRRHDSLYAFQMPWKEVEFMTFRIQASQARAPFTMRKLDQVAGKPADAVKATRRCVFPDGAVDTPIYDGRRLGAGSMLAGPAVIEEPTTTIVIPAAFECRVDDYGNYVLTPAATGRVAATRQAVGREVR